MVKAIFSAIIFMFLIAHFYFRKLQKIKLIEDEQREEKEISMQRQLQETLRKKRLKAIEVAKEEEERKKQKLLEQKEKKLIEERLAKEAELEHSLEQRSIPSDKDISLAPKTEQRNLAEENLIQKKREDIPKEARAHFPGRDHSAKELSEDEKIKARDIIEPVYYGN
ncbi:hypothetical protein N9O57_00025 [bacterium]|nr:hypothetical protein [bacterium]